VSRNLNISRQLAEARWKPTSICGTRAIVSSPGTSAHRTIEARSI